MLSHTLVDRLLSWLCYQQQQTWYFNLARVIILTILACAIVLIFLGVYNRYLHPLCKVPGPFWGSVTDFYKLAALSRDLTQFSLDLHKKYGEYQIPYPSTILYDELSYEGPIVRVSPNMISVGDPLDLPLVYHRYSDKSDFWTPGILGEHPPLLQISDHRKHKNKRKLMATTVWM